MVIQSDGAEKTTLAPGTMVGEYQITHKLGEGGMGVVYAGVHPEIGKRVAIKVLAAHAAVYPDLIRRFKEEARAVNKIRHPNIIDIFAFNQLADGRHYFVMEYLDGESLTAWLERGPMELVEMRRLLGQICSALEAAHEAGVVHRDLKPDNVWVATQHLSEPRIKLLDFGIAKLNDHSGGKTTQAGVAMGTPHYMSPEQGMGRAVDHRTDIYALGVILYQIFAGALPFDGGTAQEIIFKHVTDRPPPPSTYRRILPKPMEGIILECLEKEPAKRLASMRALGARIEAAFEAEGSTGLLASLPPNAPARPRTEILPDAGIPVSAGLPAVSRAPTTLKGAVGEVAVAPSDSDAGDDRAVAGGRSSWRRLVVIATGAVAVAAAIAVVVSGGRHRPSSAATSSLQSQSASLAAPTPPAEKPAPAAPPAAPVPPSASPATPPVEEPEPAAPPAAKAAVVPQVAAKPNHVRKIARANKAEGLIQPQPPAREPPPAKVDCTSKFYFDAQGDKHFKPECF